jgi:hypothetical protein
MCMRSAYSMMGSSQHPGPAQACCCAGCNRYSPAGITNTQPGKAHQCNQRAQCMQRSCPHTAVLPACEASGTARCHQLPGLPRCSPRWQLMTLTLSSGLPSMWAVVSTRYLHGPGQAGSTGCQLRS